jgi:hypothetical protein
MRRIDWVAGVFALLAGSAAAGVAACTSGTTDCSKYPEDAVCKGWSITTSTGTTGTGGMPPVVCTGAPSAKNNLDECAVYVEAGATGDGTMENPYGTLQQAIDNAGSKAKVYACNKGSFTEAVTISTAVEVYGGFTCTNLKQWGLPATTLTASNMSTLTGPADQVALTIKMGADGTTVSGLAITAAAGSAGVNTASTTTPAGSSVAVAVDAVTATIEDCAITAANGGNGGDGFTPSDAVMVGADAPAPVSLQEDACQNAAGIIGGAPGVTMCGAVNTSGGTGGVGGLSTTMGGVGLSGGAGMNPASPSTPPNDGKGGPGQTTSGGNCTDGDTGANGTDGAAGSGGTGMTDALALSGISNSDDTSGKDGTPAQGGGGGGSAMAGTMFCTGNVAGNGASGGGGAAGGCNGKGAVGGQAGGSSIAVISLGTKLTLTNVTLVVGAGGSGGKGFVGENGGAGGSGAKGGAASMTPPSIAGCKGGDGGVGGVGGASGGGRGGHSMGVLYANEPTPAPTLTMITTTPGTQGTGAASNDGAGGLHGTICDFSTKQCTM